MAIELRTIEQRALDEDRAAGHRNDAFRRDDGDPASWDEPASLVERFASHLVPITDEELENARDPHPHAFQDGETGLAPVGEVTVVAGAGREGKTAVMFSLAVDYVLGFHLAGMAPPPDRSVLVYSSEDDRAQYARRIGAHLSLLGGADRQRALERVIVPDLSAEGMECFATLLHVVDRSLVESVAVAAIIETLRPRMLEPLPPGLLIFETVSTLSDADEDNRSFRALVLALRRVARSLRVAVVVVHHTSQQAASSLPELNLRVADIRGGTALAFNTRQCLMVVNLGSTDDPFPEQDMRARLRDFAVPGFEGRASALVCLDSSKGVDPPPIFFRWETTPYGPALRAVPVLPDLDGFRWRRLLAHLRAERAEERREAKNDAKEAGIAEVVRQVRNLSAQGRQPTVRAVSDAAGRSPTWAKPYLAAAVSRGTLSCARERVPRVRDRVDVYRLIDLAGTVK